MLKMVDGTGIIGVDMICPLGVSTPQPPNYDRVELEGAGMLVLPNSLDAPLERLELGGKTEQFTTTGAQLIPFPYATGDMTKNGITFTVQEDGGIKVTGTATEFVIFNIAKIDFGANSIFNNSAGNGKVLSGGKDNVKIEYHGFNKNTYLAIDKGLTVNTTIYPQLQNGTKATPYEPYTGGKHSPSPEYPQEIKNSGKWNEEKQKYEVNVKITNAEQNWSKEQTLTLTSDRPITKWDKLVEQGGQIGWLYSTKKYTVTGNENYIFGGSKYYSGISTNMHTNAVKNMSGEGVCRRLKSIIGIWDKSNNTKDGFCINSGNQIHMRFFNNLLGVSDDATMEEKKAAYISYLKNEYEKGTPYEIVYQSLETEFIPLTQPEQNAIRALKTYYPTTVITADGGELDPDIKVTYRKEI